MINKGIEMRSKRTESRGNPFGMKRTTRIGFWAKENVAKDNRG
jgi:hypothetical protein